MNKNLTDSLVLDEANLKTLIENKQKIGAFAIFKTTFLGQMWNMVKANWLTLVFCIPIAAWIIICTNRQLAIDSMIPYGGNLGIGSPQVDYSYQMGAVQDFYLAMQRAVVMLPLIIIACVGLAGTFNVVKYNVWGMQVKIVKTFFKGVRNSYAPFMLVGMLLGVCYVLITFCLQVFDVYSLHIAFKICALIAAGLITLFVAMLGMYVFPQAVVFDLSIWAMLKNAFVLTRKFIVQSLIITIIGAVSALLLLLNFNEYVLMFAMMIFFMMAFSYTACVFTVFNHHVFDLIDQIKGAAPAANAQPNVTPSPKKKPAQKKAYQNPKKGKRN